MIRPKGELIELTEIPVKQGIPIDFDRVPDFLRPALETEVVRAISAELTEMIRVDPREKPEASPVASPGAPYTRRTRSN